MRCAEPVLMRCPGCGALLTLTSLPPVEDGEAEFIAACERVEDLHRTHGCAASTTVEVSLP